MFNIHVIYFFSIEYTYARSPLDYCNNIQSPPQYLLDIDEKGMFKLIMNLEYDQSFSHPSFVNQVDHPNIVNEMASSSVVENGKQLNIN